MPCGLPGQTLRKFNSKDFMRDEREIQNEIINSSDYKGKWNEFNQIELKMEFSGDWVTIAVGEESGNVWDNSSRTTDKI